MTLKHHPTGHFAEPSNDQNLLFKAKIFYVLKFFEGELRQFWSRVSKLLFALEIYSVVSFSFHI